ncbi:MAG: hypothetical protein ACYC56_08470 [Candidatus Aquicultor sp.]
MKLINYTSKHIRIYYSVDELIEKTDQYHFIPRNLFSIELFEMEPLTPLRKREQTPPQKTYDLHFLKNDFHCKHITIHDLIEKNDAYRYVVTKEVARYIHIHHTILERYILYPSESFGVVTDNETYEVTGFISSSPENKTNQIIINDSK